MVQGAFGGMPGMGMDPQQLQQMMDSPIMQNLLQNPEFLRSMMQSNPALRQVLFCHVQPPLRLVPAFSVEKGTT